MFTLKSTVGAIIADVVKSLHTATSATGVVVRGAVALAMRPDADAADACSKLMQAVRDAGLAGNGYESNIRRVFRAHPDDLRAIWDTQEVIGVWPAFTTLFRGYPEAFLAKSSGQGSGKRTKKENAEPDTLPVVDSIGAYLDFSRRMAAKINTIGLHADDAAKAAEHVLALVAILTTAKTAADRLAK